MNMNSRNVTYSTVGDYQLPNLTLPQPGESRWANTADCAGLT